MKKTLGETIRRKRQEAGKTMRQAANDLEVTERTYARWEADHDVPRPLHIDRLEFYFGIRLSPPEPIAKEGR